MSEGAPNDRRALRGSCLCGAVRFAMRGPFRPVHVCHCSQCRKWSGHVVAATTVLTDRLDIAATRELAWYRSSPYATRGFCRACGSSLFWRSDDCDLTSVMAGTIDLPTGLAVGAHIFTADASDYAAIAAEAPHHGQDVPDRWDPAAAS